MKRYVVMIKKPNGMMRIIGNKPTMDEAKRCAGTNGIIKTINTQKRKVKKTKTKNTKSKSKQKKTKTKKKSTKRKKKIK